MATKKPTPAPAAEKKPTKATFYLSPALARRLRIFAAETGKTQSELVEEAIERLLTKR
jgi:predicted DNA-binding protein